MKKLRGFYVFDDDKMLSGRLEELDSFDEYYRSLMDPIAEAISGPE